LVGLADSTYFDGLEGPVLLHESARVGDTRR